MAARAIRASVPAYPCTALVTLSCGFFVGTGYSIFGTITQLLRSIVFRVSDAWLFVTYFDFANIWWFQSFAAFCGSIVAFSLFCFVYQRVSRDFAKDTAL
jgi:Na+-driven multidrug efflux pump